MRITNGMIARHTRNYIQNGMEKLARTQEMMSTSKKIIRLSDDPTALSQLLEVKSNIEMNKQYTRNIQDGLSYLEGADTALGTAGDLLKKAKTYAIQAANETLNNDDMAAIGEQIDNMIDELIDIANTTVGGKYIFAGTKNSRPPFERFNTTANGEQITYIIYKGNSVTYNAGPPPVYGTTQVHREILDQASYAIDVQTLAPPGKDTNGDYLYEAGLFGRATYIDPGQTDAGRPGIENHGVPDGETHFTVSEGIFNTLIDLAQSLKNGDSGGVQQAIGALDDGMDHLLRFRVQVGARTNHFESVQDQLQDQEYRLTQVMSNLEDIDLARVSIDLAQQQLTYQSSLAAGAQILQVTLLDFLK
jgi:flagellar hook-associated protein 3 FlgL